MVLRLRADAFRAWTGLCAQSLSRARAEIDALNVFPVPDSDTGTNAYLTFAAGADAVQRLPADASLAQILSVHADALLTGAKGNSGVILSQLVRGVYEGLPPQSETVVDAAVVARAFEHAADAADAAVGRPVHGTILTVARAAADGAAQAVEDGLEARETFARAAEAAREALALTPTQLERLAQAGVVDAGGRALVVVLDATEQALTGRAPRTVDRPPPVPAVSGGDDLVEGGPSYEVMYLLDAAAEDIPALRERLDGLGDSLVVVGGDRLWNVHVHVDDVGAAIEAGIAAGRPYRIAVTHFAEQLARAAASERRPGRTVVVATTGSGLSELCRDAGARVLEFTRDEPLGVETVLGALRDAGTDEVVVLANNQRHVGLFEAAAKQVRDDGVRVAVIPTHAQVQGLAALAVHDPAAGFDDDVVAMSSAAAHTQHGAVTIATEPGITMAGPCRAGDVLGVVSGDFAFVGTDLADVAALVLDRLLSPSSELVTLVRGAGADPSVSDALERRIRTARVDVDVTVYEGRQENYPLFIAVE